MTRDDYSAARRVLSERFGHSRLIRSTALSDRVGFDAHLKLENELPTASFKVRGAYYALWARCRTGPIGEVVAASTGNHGAAVAWAARELGVSARIFVPLGANAVKVGRIKALGAQLTEAGADIEGARRAAESYVASSRSELLDDATNSDVPTGAGTMGLEILEQLPECASVIVPVGDSALIRGVAGAMKAERPDMRVIGVQAAGAPAYYHSWHSGRVVTTETADTIADGLATTRPTESNVAEIRSLVDEMMLVGEREMVDAMRLLLATEGVVAEPSAAASVAALLQLPDSVRAPVVALITGGNVSPEAQRRLDVSASES